jgi:hypothetical protein
MLGMALSCGSPRGPCIRAETGWISSNLPGEQPQKKRGHCARKKNGEKEKGDSHQIWVS